MKSSNIWRFFIRTGIVSIVIFIVGFVILSQTKVVSSEAFLHFQKQQLLLQQARVLLVSSNQQDVEDVQYAQRIITTHVELSKLLEELKTLSQKKFLPYTMNLWEAKHLQNRARLHVETFSQEVLKLKEKDDGYQKIFQYTVESDLGKLNSKTQLGEVSRRIDSTTQALSLFAEKEIGVKVQVESILKKLKNLQLKTPASQNEFMMEIKKIDQDLKLLREDLQEIRNQYVSEHFSSVLIENTHVLNEHENLLFQLQ